MLLVVLALAAVVVLAVGAVGTGIIKLPDGATSPADTGLVVDSLAVPDPNASPMTIAEPAAPSGPVVTPLPIEHRATPVAGALTLGDSSSVQAIQLGADGSSTTVSAPGEPWDGLKIDIPAGAWPGATLQVTAQPITGSTFGGLVTPISPLYTVSGADGMASMPVTLKIPAVIPDDSFAMGFFYDGSGHLEGMPLLAEDATSVTVATEHFSAAFLSLVKKALLETTIDSGFRPSLDDWQFANYGSFITKGGECSGQVLTEAWYYIERRLKGGASPLYGLFDNNGGEPTPSMWQDDSDGYRLASVAQHQYDVTWQSNAVYEFLTGWRVSHFDALQYDAFRYAIAVTGEPQLVSLWDAHSGHGHAMLVWLVTPRGLYVADPNYPAGLAATRVIPFDTNSGKFGTYSSGVNALAVAQGDETAYTEFVYTAKTALVDWPALAADWAAFDASTIGNAVFPDYKILVYDAQHRVWNELTNRYQTDLTDLLAIDIVGPANVDFTGATVWRGTTNIGNYGGNQHQRHAPLFIGLNPGDNEFGFAISFSQQDWVRTVSSNQVRDWRYVDFVRRHITFGPAPSPTAAAGGRWVLTLTEPAGGPFASSYEKPGEKLRVDSSSGRIAVLYNYDGPPNRHEEASVSWGPPPASAAPGSTWASTLSAAGTCSGDIDFAWAASVDAWAEWTEAGEKQFYGPSEWAAHVDCTHDSGSASLSWAFPAHGQFTGDTLEIDVSGGDSHGSDTWRYSYEWRP
jgi:hypothetical protein